MLWKQKKVVKEIGNIKIILNWLINTYHMELNKAGTPVHIPAECEWSLRATEMWWNCFGQPIFKGLFSDLREYWNLRFKANDYCFMSQWNLIRSLNKIFNFKRCKRSSVDSSCSDRTIFSIPASSSFTVCLKSSQNDSRKRHAPKNRILQPL